MAMTEREEKFVELNTTSSLLLAQTENQLGFSTDVDADYNIAIGTPIWRSNDDLHVGAVQYDINAVSQIGTPAANTFGSVTLLGDINDGSPRNGFNGKQSYIESVFSFVFDENTRVAVLSYTDNADIDVVVDGTRVIIPDGDARLTAAAISNTAYIWYTYYIDTDGQLKSTTTPFGDFFLTKCVVMSVLFAPDNVGIPGETGYPRGTGSSISQLLQHHGAESIDWRSAHHRTEGSKIAEPCGFAMSTTSTEGTPTSILSLSAGTMADEDIFRAYSAVDGATDPWVCYYYDGITGSVPDAHRGFKDVTNLPQIYVTSAEAGIVGGDANITYSLVAVDGNGIPTGATATRVNDGCFVSAHIFIGMGPLISNVIVMGQVEYNSLSEARDNLEADARDLVVSTTLLSEAVLAGSIILDSVGDIMPINNDGLMTADQRECSKKVVFGGSDEVVVPDGEGNIKSTRAITISSIELLDSTKLTHLSDNEGEFVFIGGDGVLGAFDLLGAAGGTEETVDTLALNHVYAGPAFEPVLTVIVPSTYLSSAFTYSLDLNLPNNTQGISVRILINSVPYDTTVFNSTFGNGINVTKALPDGALTALDEITVDVQAVNTSKSFTVLAGSTLDVDGQLPASASDAHFVLQENGVGSGTHTFEDITIFQDGGTPVITATGTRLLVQNNANTTDNCIVTVASGVSGKSVVNFGDIADTSAGSIIYNNTDNSLSMKTGGIDNRLYINSLGNIGVGTPTPSTKLGVAGVVTATGGNSTEWNLGYDHSIVVTGNPHVVTSDQITDSATNRFVADTQITGWDTAFTHSQLVTGNPHVVTSDQITDSAANRFVSDTQITGWDTAFTHSQLTTGNPHSLDLADIGESDASINYWTLSGSNVYRTAGNVGIGTASPQDYGAANRTLAVGNTGGGALDFIASDVGVGTNRVSQISSSIAAGLTFSTGASNSLTEKMRIEPGGNVGIGTDSPSYPFHIKADGSLINYELTDTTSFNAMLFSEGATVKAYAQYIGSTSAESTRQGNLELVSETGNIALIAGNVGIKTNEPSTALEINGELSYTSAPTWTELELGVWYMKRGGVVYLRGKATAGINKQLPVGYRPNNVTATYYLVPNGVATPTSVATVSINSTGFVFSDALSWHSSVSFVAEN